MSTFTRVSPGSVLTSKSFKHHCFYVCHRSTGDDVAHFLFNTLMEYNPTLEKLVSVSTCGASNMTGRISGMTTKLKPFIRQHCAARQALFNDFNTVWCIAHRLNLVTKDLMGLKGMSIVNGFADWFSDRSRQTNYKAFLSETSNTDKLTSIPRPSKTRRMFYYDVISAILSQHTLVERFIKGRNGFSTFWNSVKLKKTLYGPLVDKHFSFEDGEFLTLFLFAKHVLGLLRRVNLFLQESYLIVSEAWIVVNSLKKTVIRFMDTLH